MEWTQQLAQMDAKSLRALTATLLAQLAEQESQLASRDKELKTKQLKINQLTYEMAILKRWRYDRKSEQLGPVQRSLLDESIDADIEAISLEIEALTQNVASPLKEKRIASLDEATRPAVIIVAGHAQLIWQLLVPRTFGAIGKRNSVVGFAE
jgi:hypothetical protein